MSATYPKNAKGRTPTSHASMRPTMGGGATSASTPRGPRSGNTGTSFHFHPILKMPGQTQSKGTSTDESISIPEINMGPYSPDQLNVNIPKQARTRPPAGDGTSRSETPPLKQEFWEEIADNTEGQMGDDVYYVVDCFINLQQAMSEMEWAICKTAHQEDLDTGVEAARDGLDRFNVELFRVVQGIIERP